MTSVVLGVTTLNSKLPVLGLPDTPKSELTVLVSNNLSSPRDWFYLTSPTFPCPLGTIGTYIQMVVTQWSSKCTPLNNLRDQLPFSYPCVPNKMTLPIYRRNATKSLTLCEPLIGLASFCRLTSKMRWTTSMEDFLPLIVYSLRPPNVNPSIPVKLFRSRWKFCSGWKSPKA